VSITQKLLLVSPNRSCPSEWSSGGAKEEENVSPHVDQSWRGRGNSAYYKYFPHQVFSDGETTAAVMPFQVLHTSTVPVFNNVNLLRKLLISGLGCPASFVLVYDILAAEVAGIPHA
jgi:hypothetical protein